MEIKNIPNTLPPVALTGTKNLASVLPQLQPGTALNAVVTAKLAENSFLLTLVQRANPTRPKPNRCWNWGKP